MTWRAPHHLLEIITTGAAGFQFDRTLPVIPTCHDAHGFALPHILYPFYPLPNHNIAHENLLCWQCCPILPPVFTMKFIAMLSHVKTPLDCWKILH